jgi:hypothetical protein
MRSSTLAQVVKLFICIQKVSGSNLNRDTDYRVSEVLGVSFSPPNKCREFTLNKATTTSFYTIQDCILLLH